MPSRYDPSLKDDPLAGKGPILSQRLTRLDTQGLYRRDKLVRIDYVYPRVQEVETVYRDPQTHTETVLGREEMAADHVMVELKDGATRQDLERIDVQLGSTILSETQGSHQIYLIKIPRWSFDAIDTAVAAYKRERDVVAIAQPDHVYRTDSPTISPASATPTSTPADSGAKSGGLAQPDAVLGEGGGGEDSLWQNDPDVSKQWSLTDTQGRWDKNCVDIHVTYAGCPYYNFDKHGAWDITTGSDAIKVAVLGTGADYTHADVKAYNAGENGIDAYGRDKRTNGVDDDGNRYVDDFRGWNVLGTASNNDPIDTEGPGTALASIIAAPWNGYGMMGINEHVSLLPIKMMQNRTVSAYDLVQALLYARLSRVDVVDVPFALYPDFTGSERDMVFQAFIDTEDYEIPVVVAAGDEDVRLADHHRYPASYDFFNMLVVTKHDDEGYPLTDQHGGNWGPGVDLAAPGDGVYAAKANLLGDKSSSFTYLGDTGIASAHVAGAIALLKAEGGHNMAAEKVKDLIRRGVNLHHRGIQEGISETEGLLDAYKPLHLLTKPGVRRVRTGMLNGTYRAGDRIEVAVDFGHEVFAWGNPQLWLAVSNSQTGATQQPASYAGGSGTETLYFDYTVQSGDSASDLDYVDAQALDLNGGSITNAETSEDADLELPDPGTADFSLGGSSNIVVDAPPPPPPGDDTPPTPFTVTDGDNRYIDLQWRYYTSDNQMTISARWTGSNDPESGIDQYKWKIDDSLGNIIQDYKSVGTNTFGDSPPVTVLPGTTYYVTVRAYNKADPQLNTKARSDGVNVNAPISLTGQVKDGTGDDVDTLASDKLCANWKDFGGPVGYGWTWNWAIGTKPGFQDVMPMIAVGPATTSKCRSGLSDGHYYSTVQAINMWTGQALGASSDGVDFQYVQPEGSKDLPQIGSFGGCGAGQGSKKEGVDC